MRDPFYTQMIFSIENIICQADAEAKSKGITLTDAHVKSALNKARRLTEGKTPEIPECNERERILAKLIRTVHSGPQVLAEIRVGPDGKEEQVDINRRDWIAAIKRVEKSLDIRRGTAPGSRNYMDYVNDFLSDIQNRNNDG